MAKNDKPFITPTRDGPLLVKNLKKLKNSEGQGLKTSPTMMLCRCGGSRDKPFCDRSHLRNGFNDEKEPGRVKDRTDNYEGRDIIIHDNRGVCSHREHCIHQAPKVFKRRAKPWIDPDAQDEEETIQAIKMCPSGALSYTKEGVLFKEWKHGPAIIISKDGPYDVQGSVKLNDPDGNQPESKSHYTLCRCGYSKNKPFCDGRHWRFRFKDSKN